MAQHRHAVHSAMMGVTSEIGDSGVVSAKGVSCTVRGVARVVFLRGVGAVVITDVAAVVGRTDTTVSATGAMMRTLSIYPVA